MAPLKFCFVHGFLGKAHDWDPLIQELTKRFPEGFEWITYDVWRSIDRWPQGASLENWGQLFEQSLGDGPYIMVGYSLGGRLLLHGPWSKSRKIKSLILISAKIFIDPKERGPRLQKDQTWAERFLRDPWEKLIKDWESQDVFLQDTVRPLRRENEYSRELLARTLDECSLGRQELDLAKINAWIFPVLSINGSKDQAQIAHRQKLEPILAQWSWVEVPGGHSPHFSHSGEVAVVIDKFVRYEAETAR